MIVVKENTVVWNLLRIIALCGEYPVYQIGIMGNRREYRKRICELQLEQTFLNPYTGQTMTVRALTISSYGRTKSVRILKSATGLLKWVGYYRTYEDRFLKSNFHGDEEHLDRNHRVAETTAMFLRADFPAVYSYDADMTQRKKAVLYMPHVLKAVNEESEPKSMYMRITGGFRTPEECFAVYNTRDRMMKWFLPGETKSKILLREKFGHDLSGAILLGKDYETGMKTALSQSSGAGVQYFYRFYGKLFFAPFGENGTELLRLFTKSRVSERILELMFDPADRSYGNGRFNYHAKIGDVFVYSFLDSDLRGLIEFRNGMRPGDRTEILCYDFQTEFLKGFFREAGTRITEIPFDAVKDNLS